MTDIPQIGGIAAEAVRQFVLRIERLNDEIKALNADKADVFKQAKSQGFDPAVLREVIKIRLKGEDEADEFSQVVALYMAAVNGTSPRVRVHEG